MDTDINEELIGYLPLAKLKKEIMIHNSIKDGIYSFVRYQKCLLEGKKNLNKLKKLFKKHNLRKSKKNHIFILDTNIYLVFANCTDFKIYYIYNEFSFDITIDFLEARALNCNKCYHAFNFINLKINIIQDYFVNIFQYNLEDDYIESLSGQQNIIHNDIKKFISPHGFKTIHTSPHYELMSDTFYYVNKFALENYMEESKHNIIFESSSTCYFELSIKIKNGTFSIYCIYKEKTENDRITNKSTFLATNESAKILTTYSPIADIGDTYSFGTYKLEQYKNIFSKFNVKEKLRNYFEQLQKNKRKV